MSKWKTWSHGTNSLLPFAVNAMLNSSKQFLWIKKLRETTNLCVEIMNSKRQVKGKLGHVVQIRVCRLT